MEITEDLPEGDSGQLLARGMEELQENRKGCGFMFSINIDLCEIKYM